MKILFTSLLIGFVLIFWYMANIFSKPVLNRMSNYYEDDKDGRLIANILIGVCIVASIWIGHLLF
jgi:hypothetical protein